MHLRVAVARRIIPASAGQTTSSNQAAAPATDHPRECGANEQMPDLYNEMDGSSPRVRGKPAVYLEIPVLDRIIPASAGQTSCRNGVWEPTADHPRECGANPRLRAIGPICCGSSPRVRGKLVVHQPLQAHRRIIPASAGQTGHGWRSFVVLADHPRECGANRTLSNVLLPTIGSSPRVRGKHRLLVRTHQTRRIIPASAGQTNQRQKFQRQRADHPRECGANSYERRTRPNCIGSSPRVRGKLVVEIADARGGRIIPASAGQTWLGPPWPRVNPDHPRECGANLVYGTVVRADGGSSPRVRGKLGIHIQVAARRRIIPASAGQTASLISPMVASTDHPRECGAN